MLWILVFCHIRGLQAFSPHLETPVLPGHRVSFTGGAKDFIFDQFSFYGSFLFYHSFDMKPKNALTTLDAKDFLQFFS